MNTTDLYSPFFWCVLKKFKLTPNKALFLTYIESLSRKNGWCFASRETIAKTLNLSEPTIYKIIKDLKNSNLLEEGEYSRFGTKKIKPGILWYETVDSIREKIKLEKLKKSSASIKL